MRAALRALAVLAALLYPLAVWFGLQLTTPRVIALLLAAVMIVRVLAAPKAARKGLLPLVAVGVLLALLGVLSNATHWLLIYPLAVSLVLLALFLWSLRHPPSAIERLARLQEPDLDADGVRYTRKVTQVWCGFFVVNAGLSAWTVLRADLAIWTLYNGLIAYLLMGTLFIGEWLVRQRVRAKKSAANSTGIARSAP